MLLIEQHIDDERHANNMEFLEIRQLQASQNICCMIIQILNFLFVGLLVLMDLMVAVINHVSRENHYVLLVA